jgi:hypothetical protein
MSLCGYTLSGALGKFLAVEWLAPRVHVLIYEKLSYWFKVVMTCSRFSFLASVEVSGKTFCLFLNWLVDFLCNVCIFFLAGVFSFSCGTGV